MGFHRPGLVAIGAFVDIELKNYLDRLVEEHGLSTRSDALRLVIREHKDEFSHIIDRNKALTPSDIKLKDKHHIENKRVDRSLK